MILRPGLTLHWSHVNLSFRFSVMEMGIETGKINKKRENKRISKTPYRVIRNSIMAHGI